MKQFKQIDILVYELYGSTEEEIRIVEAELGSELPLAAKNE